jgi:hypothetical protein
MTNFEVLQELYRCFREKDHDGFRGLCTEDLVWIQNPGFPKGTIRKGADEVIDGIFKGLRLEWDDFSYNIEQMLDAGSSIVVIGEYLGVHSVSRKAMRASAAHVYDLRDGKISRFRMFADTKPMWDAMS